MPLTRRQPLVFQGDGPQLGVGVNLKLQLICKCKFLKHLLFQAPEAVLWGDTGLARWKCPPHSALAVGAAGRRWHGRLQIRQGNRRQRRTRAVPKARGTLGLPSDPQSPRSTLPGGAGRGDPSSLRALHSTHHQRPCSSTRLCSGAPRARVAAPTKLPWDGAASTPGSCRCCPRTQR